MAKRIDPKQLNLVAQIVGNDDPGPSRSVLDVFVKGMQQGYKLDIILKDMADVAEKELDA